MFGQVRQLQEAARGDRRLRSAEISIELASIAFDLHTKLKHLGILDNTEQAGRDVLGSGQLVQNDVVLIAELEKPCSCLCILSGVVFIPGYPCTPFQIETEWSDPSFVS